MREMGKEGGEVLVGRSRASLQVRAKGLAFLSE